jgi:hypothetical protein
MNYAKAVKLLYRVDISDVIQLLGGNTEKLERDSERMSRRKFKFVVSMQRYSKLKKTCRIVAVESLYIESMLTFALPSLSQINVSISHWRQALCLS